MKILSIETSTMRGGVALVDQQMGLLSEIRLNVNTSHSERLFFAIDHLLELSSVELAEVDVIAVSIGPGSFTGLRIGLSTAKGLCFATNKKLVAVPTLEAFAWNFPFAAFPVCLMLDARKDEVYAGVFQWHGSGFNKLMNEVAIKPEDLIRTLSGSVIFAGEGAEIYEKLIFSRFEGMALFPSPDKMVPSPGSVAILGLEMALRGDFRQLDDVIPFYGRKSEAEIKWKNKPT